MRNFVKIVENHLLNELQGYKGTDEFKAFQDIIGRHSNKKSRLARSHMLQTFVEFLEGKGFQSLGQGAFGATFMHDNLDYVIKIFRNDPAYLTYVGYILKNKDNPYLPRFRGRFMKLDQDNYVVRMEKLTNLYSSNISQCVLYAAEKVRDVGADEWLRQCAERLKPEDNGFDQTAFDALTKKVEELENAYYEAFNKIRRAKRLNYDLELQKTVKAKAAPIDPGQGRLDLAGGAGVRPPRQMYDLDALIAIKDQRLNAYHAACDERNEMEDQAPRKNEYEPEMRFCVENPEFLKTIQQIIELGFDCDFHDGNFMVRGETPVITDPLYDRSSFNGRDETSPADNE